MTEVVLLLLVMFNRRVDILPTTLQVMSAVPVYLPTESTRFQATKSPQLKRINTL